MVSPSPKWAKSLSDIGGLPSRVREHTDRQAKVPNLPYWLRNTSVRVIGKGLWMPSFSTLRDPYQPAGLT
jgi:hypothetical protein